MRIQVCTWDEEGQAIGSPPVPGLFLPSAGSWDWRNPERYDGRQVPGPQTKMKFAENRVVPWLAVMDPSKVRMGYWRPPLPQRNPISAKGWTSICRGLLLVAGAVGWLQGPSWLPRNRFACANPFLSIQ